MANTLLLNNWITPASSYHEERIGDFRISKGIYDAGLYYYKLDEYEYFQALAPLTKTSLQELRDGEWHEWMVDGPTDYRAMQKYSEKATGRVLTSGLGLGLVVHELCKNSAVQNITVIEQSPAVMALVSKYLPKDNRVEVRWGDFWKFIIQDESDWDWIIADIWVYRGLQRKEELLQQEVSPMGQFFQTKHPKAQVIFHGFETHSSYKGNLDEVLKRVRG